MIIPKHYEDIHVLHENTMPDRAYYIPAGTRQEGLEEHRERSDRFQSLNGVWDFCYYDSIHEVKEEFFGEYYGPGPGWDKLTVPSVCAPGESLRGLQACLYLAGKAGCP